MLGAALATDEAVRVRVDAEAGAAADRCAVRVADARVGVATGLFAGQRQVDRAVRVDLPRVPRIELGEIPVQLRPRHPFRVRQARGGIGLGMPGDRAGLVDGGLQAGFAQVRGAGAAAPAAEVDGHRDAAVAGRLHGFHLAHPHAGVQAALLRAGHLGLVGATGTGEREQPGRGVGQCVEAADAVVVGGDGFVQWLILCG